MALAMSLGTFLLGGWRPRGGSRNCWTQQVPGREVAGPLSPRDLPEGAAIRYDGSVEWMQEALTASVAGSTEQHRGP